MMVILIYSPPIRLGIIGKPNTGKSTLLNSIIDQKRVVTGSKAGITRDAIEVSWHHNKQPFVWLILLA